MVVSPAILETDECIAADGFAPAGIAIVVSGSYACPVPLEHR
jgi:hypothetical protein